LDQARSLDELAERPELSFTLDEACLQMFPRRTLTTEEAEAAANGRALTPAGIDGVYAAQDADGRVIALLRDDGPKTKSVVVIRPATL
jgi:tRNA pseudouridine55 synthase